MMKTFSHIFASLESRSFLILLFLFSLLRLPSLFEPDWYGDEGIYQVVGRALRNGRMLYSQIWDNKPPLLYVTYAFVNSDLFWIRLLSYIAGILAVYFFYLLSKRLFKNQTVYLLSSSLFAFLFAIPTTEGNIANAENFMLVFLIGAGLLLLKELTEKKIISQKHLFLTGVLVSIAFLYKIVAIFDFAAFFLFILFLTFPKRRKFTRSSLAASLRPLLVFTTGFLLPIFATMLFFLLVGAFSQFLTATFSNNVSYVGYKNFFLIPQGLLIVKLLALGVFVLFLFSKRESLTKSSLFIFLWFSFSLFNAFFSQRPYTHYVLVAIASFSLLVGLLLQEKRYRLPTLILLIGGGIALSTTFEIIKPGKITGYYANFLSYLSGKKSTDEYRSFFDSDTPRDYELAEFLKSRVGTEQTIFMWGNTAQIYALSDTLPPGRFTVAYHINSKSSIDETQLAVDRKRPKFIVLLPDSPIIPLDLSSYVYAMTIGNTTIYQRRVR